MEQATTDHAFLRLDDKTLGTYNAWDTVATARVFKALKRELEANGQLEFYRREFWPLVPAVLAMQRRGVPVDMAERTRLRKQFRREVRETDKLLVEAAGEPRFNPNADAQVRKWLFGGDKTVKEHGEPVPVPVAWTPEGRKTPKREVVTIPCLGLRPAGRTEGKVWSVDRTNLLRVLRDLRKKDEHARDTILGLVHRSRFVKLDEYLDFEHREGRLYPRVKMYGTKTLRFAYSDPPLHSWADEIRSVVRARPGYRLLRADYKQFEARIAAVLMRDKRTLAVFEQGLNLHQEMAKQFFGITDDEWAALPPAQQKSYKDVEKTLYFGTILYGGAPETAKSKTTCPCPKCAPGKADTLSLTNEQKRRTVERWFAQHPEVVRWRNEIMRNFDGPHATRSVRSPFGYRRYFTKPQGAELQREVYNWPVQHCAACLLNRAIVALHEQHAPILFSHHDALYLEVPESEVVEWGSRLRGAMETPVAELGGLSFPVDLEVGDSWSSLETLV